MNIYIASSWKNQHAVEMLTALLRERGHEVLSFVENSQGEQLGYMPLQNGKPVDFDEWCGSGRGFKSFEFDTRSAMTSDIVIYLGPSGPDAWAEVGAAYGSGKALIVGLWAKGETIGLMRRMVKHWYYDFKDLVRDLCVEDGNALNGIRTAPSGTTGADLYSNNDTEDTCTEVM